MRPELTDEEKARPFAKYYYDEIPQPDPAHYNAMETPIDPKDAFGPEEINRMLDVDALRKGVEVGWCNLPNGAGYIANTIFYPGVTAEMIDWWFVWHTLEDLRYRIWYPPQHAGIMLSPIDRARVLDPNIAMREKNWGLTHYVTENCDCGMDNVDINFKDPTYMGFDMDKFNKVAATLARRVEPTAVVKVTIWLWPRYSVPTTSARSADRWPAPACCRSASSGCISRA